MLEGDEDRGIERERGQESGGPQQQSSKEMRSHGQERFGLRSWVRRARTPAGILEHETADTGRQEACRWPAGAVVC